MASAKKSKGGRGRPPKPKSKKAVVIVNDMNLRINGKSYVGSEGDTIEFAETWHYDKAKTHGLVK
jgi:uncharacterized Zn-binding protein involved in type VI secretion